MSVAAFKKAPPEGLSDLASRVASGEPISASEFRRLRDPRSLHMLRALADDLRQRSSGNEVLYAFAKDPEAALAGAVVVDSEADLWPQLLALSSMRPARTIVRDPQHVWTGIELLSACALCRLSTPIEARIEVLWAEVGPELAQVLLGYGVSALLGPIARHLGGSGADLGHAELRALIYRAGRIPVERPASPEPRP